MSVGRHVVPTVERRSRRSAFDKRRTRRASPSSRLAARGDDIVAAIAGMAEAAGKEIRALPRWRMLLVDRRRTCRAATAGRGASSRAAFAQTGAWSPSLGQLGMRVCIFLRNPHCYRGINQRQDTSGNKRQSIHMYPGDHISPFIPLFEPTVYRQSALIANIIYEI